MRDGRRVLGLVCARGGSQGLPRKNVLPLAGQPLIAHSVNALRAWGGADRIVCSTDDDEIAAAAEAAGASAGWRRPAELAGPEVGKLAVIRHAVTTTEAEHGPVDLVVDVDVTAPIRTVDDIEATVALLDDGAATNALTVTPARKNPYFNLVEASADGFIHVSKEVGGDVLSRQAAPSVYEINGSVYAYTRSYLEDATSAIGPRTRMHVMPRERSVDIDEPIDLLLIEALLAAGLGTLPEAP